ncbi:MAG: hypothetical protein GXP62_05150, partial [Oligoflexia bacterium]|nr:hypothetical protein [Oligoflexia bacterium]
MGWLAALIFAVGFSTVGFSTVGFSTVARAGTPPAPASPITESDVVLPWQNPPRRWRIRAFQFFGEPQPDDLLTVIRRQDATAPTALRRPGGLNAGETPDWEPSWLRIETEQQGHWLIWWNQERPTWEAWEVWLGEGKAKRLYRGGSAGRPAWVVATLSPPMEAGSKLPAPDAPAWWDRYAAALQLPADALPVRLLLARDPNPAVRSVAQAMLGWTLRETARAGPWPPGVVESVRALVAVLASSDRPQERSNATGLAMTSLDPTAVSAIVPLLCDADLDVSTAAFYALADLLPQDALRPWQVHPYPDLGRLASRALDEPRLPRPGSREDAAWPLLRPAVAAAWQQAGCTPAFAGRYDVAIWSPTLATHPVDIVLRDAAGAVVGHGRADADPSYTRALPLAVSAPPAFIDVSLGDTTFTESVPPAVGAALGLACDSTAPPLQLGPDPAAVWLATRNIPGRARCIDSVMPALQAWAATVPDDDLVDEIAGHLSMPEALGVSAVLLSTDRPMHLRLKLADRFVLPLSRGDCVTGVRALLATGPIDENLGKRVTRCRINHPDLYPELIDAVYAGRLDLGKLLPIPTSIDDADHLRVTRVAARAL